MQAEFFFTHKKTLQEQPPSATERDKMNEIKCRGSTSSSHTARGQNVWPISFKPATGFVSSPTAINAMESCGWLDTSAAFILILLAYLPLLTFPSERRPINGRECFHRQLGWPPPLVAAQLPSCSLPSRPPGPRPYSCFSCHDALEDKGRNLPTPISPAFSIPIGGYQDTTLRTKCQSYFSSCECD